MAKIDKLLQALAKYKAEQLIFRSLERPVLMIAGEFRPVTQKALTSKQIITILKEISDSDHQAMLDNGKSTTFSYELAGCGNFKVKADIDQDNVLTIIQQELTKTADNSFLEAHLEKSQPIESAPATPPSLSTPESAEKAVPLPSRIKSSFAGPISKPASEIKLPDLSALLKEILDRKASDLFLSSNTYPKLKVEGKIIALEQYGEISSAALKQLIYNQMRPDLISRFEQDQDVDFSLEVTGSGRFCTKVLMDVNGIEVIFRPIEKELPSLASLDIPKGFKQLCELEQGLIIITGKAFSGKFQTMAAIVEYINQTFSKHIITFEYPIKYLYTNQKSFINQREVYTHTPSFATGLKAAASTAPDVVMVERLENDQTIKAALELANSGCLVIGALHSDSVISALDYIMDCFAADQQGNIRHLLSKNLKGIMAQTVLEKQLTQERFPVYELLLATSSVANLIYAGKHNQIASVIKANKRHGMIALVDSLLEKVTEGEVTPEEAYAKALDKADFLQLLNAKGFKLKNSRDGK